MDASVAFIICGTLATHKQLANVLQPSVEANIMEQPVVDAWVARASASLEGNSVLQRDEAMRSASLAAMTLMLAAQGMGLGSCPMSGFDAPQVAREFGPAATELPGVIVGVGYPAIGNWPQKVRKEPGSSFHSLRIPRWNFGICAAFSP
jgi:nitroreductase